MISLWTVLNHEFKPIVTSPVSRLVWLYMYMLLEHGRLAVFCHVDQHRKILMSEYMATWEGTSIRLGEKVHVPPII